MAKLTACFALSAILLLATEICSGTGQLLDSLTGCLQFPGQPTTSPCDLSAVPPMRIISRGNTSLSIAVDDDAGKVVLAKTRCSDPAQLWDKRSPVAGENRFLLVNIGTKGQPRAMQIPEDGTNEVKLAPYNPVLPVDPSMLWKQDDPINDGFYKIRSSKNPDLVLDGLLFDRPKVQEGTVVGAFPATHDDDNIFWKIEGFLSNP